MSGVQQTKKGHGCGWWLGVAFVVSAFIGFGAIIYQGSMGSRTLAAPTPTDVPIVEKATNAVASITGTCEQAMKAAAAVSSLQDTVEDIDPAIRACGSMDEFIAASAKFPEAVDTGENLIVVRNRCYYNQSLQYTLICRSLAESSITPTSTRNFEPTLTAVPEVTPTAMVLVVQAKVLNVRQEPGTENPIVAKATQGQSLEFLYTEEFGQWAYVRTSNGVSGWVAMQYVATATPGIVELSPVAVATSSQTGSGQPGIFSRLEIAEVAYDGTKVVITGRTDLPNGSQVLVTLDVAGGNPDDTYIGVSSYVLVQDGGFLAALTPPNRPEFAKGPYLAEVMFTPKAQTATITSLVGDNGEHLGGPSARSGFGFQVLETVTPVELNLKLTSPPQMRPESFPANSAERALAEYLAAWQKRDWQAMAARASVYWRLRQDDPAERLMAAWDVFELLGAEVLSQEVVSETTEKVTIKLYTAVGAEIVDGQTTVMVLKQAPDGYPSVSGTWGVNPVTLLGYWN